MARFYLVRCKCGQEQTVFSHVSRRVDCPACRSPLAQPSGGEAVILGEKLKELD